jgi:sigma-B regulation protein RsbU (phosphoserine phosphatase)
LPDWIYKDSEIRLESGDRLLLYTDGVTEAENQQSEEFGEDRLVRAAQTGDGTAVQIQRKIMETVTEFCVKNFHDDATLVVAAIL